MIGFLKGNILQIKKQKIILDVNNVGYEIYLTNKDLNKLYINKQIFIYIHYYQKEDNIFLFGFLLEETKELFEILIEVNGIGPKMGMTILSEVDNISLIYAILDKNIKILTSISGIGEKIAQRIILELKDKINNYIKINNLNYKENQFNNKINNSIINDVEKALLFLGYTKKEIVNVIKKISKEDNLTDTDKLIKIALKELSK